MNAIIIFSAKEGKKCEQFKNDLISATDNYQKEVRTLSAKLADETALALTLEEENKKLKTKLDKSCRRTACSTASDLCQT